MIKNIKMNVKKTHKNYQLIAEAHAHAEGLFNAQLTLINVANSK